MPRLNSKPQKLTKNY